MAKKKTKTKNQSKPEEVRTTSASTRVMQIIFIIFSVMIVLSMILSATASF
ncbi:MAG TPA: hypothetical protein VJ972_10470 [Anaerolineales bacterium]|nr:hypothetical protein [Anaerolineales bacterium]